MTVFLGCGFAAKYREGGGVFSVPLQWMLGLRRLGLDAVWLEFFPASADRNADQAAIRSFQRQVRSYGLNYCLLYQRRRSEEHDLALLQTFGMNTSELRGRLAGPNTLLNLSNSIHPPLLHSFERRIFCDLDPSEIFYWMQTLELGQSTHHEFWTIGLNYGAPDCRLPDSKVKWRTFFPLVDTEMIQRQPAPTRPKFTTVGQWYWGGAVEVEGAFPDLSKRFGFEKYLDLPREAPAACFELAMNMPPGDSERARLRSHRWHLVDPHRVARTARRYRSYLAEASGEFTTIKGVDAAWKTGWLSDRAAAFMATGRPVVTENTGIAKFLPEASGLLTVQDLASAAQACEEILRDWNHWSQRARATSVELFEATKTLAEILG